MSMQITQLLASRDQVQAMLRGHHEDIVRVAVEGPKVTDAQLIRMVFCVVAGDQMLREIENDDAD